MTDIFIDKFLGKFVKIQIDVSPDIVNQKLGVMNLYYHTDGHSVSEDIMIDSNSVFQYRESSVQGIIDVSLDLDRAVPHVSGFYEFILLET